MVEVIEGQGKGGGYELPGRVKVKKRELEILALVAEGLSNEEIANKLDVKVQTVINNINNLMRKLRANNRTHAFNKAIEDGMLFVMPKPNALIHATGEYLLCGACKRAYSLNDAIRVTEEPYEIDHVKQVPDAWYKCPYDCQEEAKHGIDWNEIRKYYPNYPEVPEKDKKYDTSRWVQGRLNRLI
jgi:DNA-binding CsgD family transcriptional regulator